MVKIKWCFELLSSYTNCLQREVFFFAGDPLSCPETPRAKNGPRLVRFPGNWIKLAWSPDRPPGSGGQTPGRGETGRVPELREESMGKLAFFVALSLFVITGAAYAELDSLKGLGKEAGKSLKQSGQDTALAAVTKKLKKVQNEKGPIKFKTGKSEVDPACDRTMTAIAAIMSDYPGFHVQVDGHTDNVGNPDANRKLSQDRAESVVRYLVEKKAVDGKRLSAKGFGDSKPIADNKTKAGQAKNRRVDFTVNKM